MSKPDLQLPSQALTRKANFIDVDADSIAANEDYKDLQLLHGFKIDNLGVLLEPEMMSELLTNLSVCSLPNTNQTLYGMANLRGNIIPVFDLRFLLGMPECEYKYFLVLGTGENSVSVLLDEVPTQVNLQELEKLSAFPPIPDVLRPHVTDSYYSEDSEGLWVDCDLMQFFESLSRHIK